MNGAGIQRKLDRRFCGRVKAELLEDKSVLRLFGVLDSWADVIAACQLAVDKRGRYHVVNDIEYSGGVPPMRQPQFSDSSLAGAHPDVMVIGAGISGASIARELTKWRLSVLLVDKEPDIAMQASGRNDGEVHPGIDLSNKTLKHKYIRRGNRLMEQVCRELSVPFLRCGQYVGFTQRWLFLPVLLYALERRFIGGIEDTRMVSARTLKRREPGLNPKFAFGIYNPSAGSVCPYSLAIAYAENAVQNGAKVSLQTAVTGMELENGRISAVHTNRGTVYPRLVINAAGVFAEDIARMAGDRFYSIHGRRGTNSILDKKTGARFGAISSIKQLKNTAAHTKGGGVVHTAHGNLLVGPNAVETPEREERATRAEDIAGVFKKQKQTLPSLSEKDIITYFTGVRACTFEEDYVIERGRKTENLIHCAGIQSPGLTTAPAVAQDVGLMAAEMLSARPNPAFDKYRTGIPVVRELSEEERARLIAENPDFGVIVCRCEQISRGEILAALDSPICVPTLDGVKKRVRPGMGRCQGGFCLPLVMQLIAEHQGIPLQQVKKDYPGASITFCGKGDKA